MVWACCWRSVDTRTYNAARIGGSFLLCCRRRRPTQHQLVRPIPPRLPVRLFAGLPPDLEGAPHGRPPAAAVSLGRATPAGLPLPQRPPPPVQTKLAMTGPAELVTGDQTIEKWYGLAKPQSCATAVTLRLLRTRSVAARARRSNSKAATGPIPKWWRNTRLRYHLGEQIGWSTMWRHSRC